MELSNNKVLLSRREKRTLFAPDRRVAAAAIGRLWRSAMDQTVSLLHTTHTEPVRSVPVVGPLGAVIGMYQPRPACNIGSLTRRRHELAAMEHAAWAISQETIPALPPTLGTSTEAAL